jgi:hypothetical protein
MTQSCCPTCRLRFSRATAAHLVTCPFCAAPLATLAADAALGFRLLAMEGLAADLPLDESSLTRAATLPPPPDAPRPRIH